MRIDDMEVFKTLCNLKCNQDGTTSLFELRVLDGKKIYSGYFDDVEQAISSLKRLQSEKSAYIVLNKIKSACSSRGQYGQLVEAKTTTSDNDIEGYEWLFIDLDPTRPTDVSSSDDELKLAEEKCNAIRTYLKSEGFEEPIVALSGNGYHLLYRIKISVQNKDLIKKFLTVMSMLFSDEHIKIDTANHNPARICKLYGTYATKGRNTKERPHRMARILNEPEEIKITDKRYVEKICAVIPDKPQYSYSQHFVLEDWLAEHGIRYTLESGSGYDKFILEECPFDSSHKGKDAAIFRFSNGALGFKCFHNSCSDKTWSDVRRLYEPTYQEKREMEFERKAYVPNHVAKSRVEVKGGEMESIKTIISKPKVEESYIRTGISMLDKKMRGLKKGTVSVVSGLRGSAKSTILSQVGLNAVNDGYRVGVFSGELTDRNFARWMMLQAAGKNYVEYGGFEGYYNVPMATQERIADWLEGKFYLYNNEHGNKFNYVLEVFSKACDTNHLDLIVMDNLMAFNISELGSNKWDAQTEFILQLQRFAKSKNVHVVFVAHPKKANGFLRLDDISGTADLGNAVDNAFIVHRNNNDFKRLSQEMFKWTADNEIYQGTNIVEVTKERENGTQDLFIPLWYESETKRMKNSKTEMLHYGWDTYE